MRRGGGGGGEGEEGAGGEESSEEGGGCRAGEGGGEGASFAKSLELDVTNDVRERLPSSLRRIIETEPKDPVPTTLLAGRGGVRVGRPALAGV